jgi:hypothetical protein
MKKNGKINDLVSLEKEIYRLKLESKMTEARFDKNLEFLKKNYPQMIFNSVLSRNSNYRFKQNLFRNEMLNNIVSNVTDHIAEYATAGIREKIDHLFGKYNK